MSQLNPLSQEEKDFIPKLRKILLKSNPNKTIYAKDLVKGINDRKDILGLTRNFSEVRLRKMVNFMRTNSILPIISNGKGYYVSYDKEDILEMIKSLRVRRDAIEEAASGLDYILKQVEADDIKEVEIDSLGFIWK